MNPQRTPSRSTGDRRWSRQAPAALAALLALPVTLTLAQAQAPRLVQIEVGAQQEVTADRALDRVAVGDPAVADVMVMRNAKGVADGRVLVLGKGPGRTTLMVWAKGASTAVSYDVQVSMAAPPAGLVQHGKVQSFGKATTILGSLPDMESHRDLAATATEVAGKKALVDRSQVAVRSNTVQVDVKVVEFSKTAMKQAGFNFFNRRGYNSQGFNFQVGYPNAANPAATFPASGGIPAALSQAFNLVFDFRNAGATLALNLLESNNLARVLAEPTLVALSGQSASFLAGGEIPIPVPQSLGTVSIEYKPFGIGLSVTPTILSNDRIVLKVAPEASDLDFTNAVTLNGVAVPAITTRRADTTVELGDGESFVIGGLVSRNTLSSVDKIPTLGDVPVIGTFFKQQKYEQNERELVIVVTPRLVRPIPAGTDLDRVLPGQAERRKPDVWSAFVLPGANDFVPGFSK